ncbi:TPA: SDR family NAD(P)-dependent oxidoreductase [Serratia marcescens]
MTQHTLPEDAIAIVGASCRVPGATNLEQFWSLIAEGRVAIEQFSIDAARRAGVAEEIVTSPGFVPSNGTLNDIELFDARFFGIAPSQAAMMDPQQRIFLECVHEALEHAGHGNIHGPRVGIWAGSATVDYLIDHVQDRLDRTSPNRFLQHWVGVDKDYLATQVAYRLNFGGPAITLQTACSTSLVAVVNAVQGLLSYQCDFAVAGGVCIALPQQQGYIYEEGSILSANGACRPFTSESNGTVFGNGAGVVLLRRLEDALEDGDNILAVVRGSAVNNDGAARVGFTAPGGRGQREVISNALAFSDIDGESIGYVETHGTGTMVGDEVELTALMATLGGQRTADKRCALGTLKANIGHLNAAAGVCGLIKASLVVNRAEIPAAVGSERAIDSLQADATFYLPTTTESWDAPIRRAGVSSFGIGGTNAHVVLESSSSRELRKPQTVPLLLLSARGEELRELSANYARLLHDTPDISLEDVCFTAAIGRHHWEWRAAFRADSHEQLIAALENYAAARPDDTIVSSEIASRPPEVSFAFGGDNLDIMLEQAQTWLGHGITPASVCAIGDGVFAAAYVTGALTLEQAQSRNFDVTAKPESLWISAVSSLPVESDQAVREELTVATGSLAGAETALAAVSAKFILELGNQPLGLNVPGAVSLDPAATETLATLWSAGVALDLNRFYRNGNRLALPTYPYQRQRHWLERANRAFDNSDISPFLGRRTDVPALNTVVFDAEWSVAKLPFLQDHIIYGQVVVSGAALAVMIVEGARAVIDSDISVLTHLSFPAAVIIQSDGAQRIQLQLVRDGNHFNATVLAPDTLEVHATATVSIDEVFSEITPQEVPGEHIPDALLDSWLRSRSVVMGPTFRRLSDITVGDNLASGAMRNDKLDDGWLPHPGVLDSALQLVAAAARPEGNKAFVPTRIAQLTLRKRAGSQMRCYADATRGFASVFDQHGVLIELSGMESREVSRNELLRVTPMNECYALEWHVPERNIRFELPATIVLLPDSGSVATNLAALLQDEGIQASIITNTDEIPFDQAGLIIDCRGAQLMSSVPDTELYSGAMSLFARAAQQPRTCRIAMVLDKASPAASPLQALARVAAMENAHLLTLAIHADDAPSVRRGLDYFEHETQVMVTAGNVTAQRFTQLELSPQREYVLASNATWLITGGLGDLGLQVADWLIGMGARHLVLASRKLPQAQDLERLQVLQHRGAEIRVIQTDISVATDIEALLNEIATTMPPLRGLFHLAGIVEDQLIPHVSEQSLSATFAGKAQGAWLLHEQLRHYELEHFVLFSSAAAAFGAAGQSSYAMANTYLDALATWRYAQGQPALSLAWGPWLEVGMHARTHAAAKRRLAQLGIGAINLESGRATFEIALSNALPPHVVVLPVDWPQLIEQWPQHIPTNSFNEIVTLPAETTFTPSGSELLALSPEQRRHRLFTLIAADAAAVTGTPVEQIDPERSLFDYDLDSLLITDLRARLEKRFALSIATTTLFSNPTIASLADYVAQVLFGSSARKIKDAPATENLPQGDIAELLAAKLVAIKAEQHNDNH